jgi:ELWxxDGT repeat protein
MKKKSLLIILCLCSIYYSYAQFDIKNISGSAGEKFTWPREFITYNNLMFFKSLTAVYGDEIWVSDGNSANTKLLKDIKPGTGNGITTTFSQSSAAFHNSLYFVADDGVTGGELWKTDGTTDGTLRVTDSLNAYIPQLTVVGDAIFFLCIKQDPLYYIDTLQVWKSDGTKSGTVPITEKKIIWNSGHTFQGKCNNTFMFTFETWGANNPKLWRSDGTAAGTFAVSAELNGNGAGYVTGYGGTDILTQYIEFNNNLFFVTSEGIMKSDGTIANTKLIAGGIGGGMREPSVIEINNKLYFSFYAYGNPQVSVYESDGTNDGTKLIYNQYSGKYIIPSVLGKSNTSLLFTGPNLNDQTCLLSLNTTDHSVSEITVIADNPVRPNSYMEVYNACFLNAFGDNVFISVPIEWDFFGWVYNSTKNTLQQVDTLNEVRDVIAYNNKLVFYKYVSGMSNLWILSTDQATGLNQIQANAEISIYPNPAHDDITVNLEGKAGKPVDLIISNMQGQVVKTLHYCNNNHFNISDLPKGSYFLTADMPGKKVPLKFIKY